MRILNEKPPIYDECNQAFKLEEKKITAVFTYADTIYNPFDLRITQDLIIHESVHSEQHEHNETVAKLWWQRYLVDTEFRLSQEVEAYRTQYEFLKKVYKDKNRQARILNEIAGLLSGSMYGNIIGIATARKIISTKSQENMSSIINSQVV